MNRHVEFTRFVPLATLLLATVCFAQETLQPPSQVAPADPAKVQLAVEKGLFFVERQSMEWWNTQKCSTCHEGGILLVAANVAKSQGVPVDQEKLDFWTDRWVLVDGITRKSKKGELVGLGMWTAPLMYLYRDADREESQTRAAMWAAVIRGSLALQDKDGHWPGSDVDVTPRMALALASLEASKMPLPADLKSELTERRVRAEAWIRAQDPQRPDKTESLAAWIAYELERGEPTRANQLLEELRSRRNEDGGWGITRAEPRPFAGRYHATAAGQTGAVFVCDTMTGECWYASVGGKWRSLGRPDEKAENRTAIPAPQP